MGKKGNLKRQTEAELAGVSKTGIIIAAGVCVGLGILFALCCIDRYVYFYTLQPRCRLSPFFAVLLWTVALAVYGASMGLLFTVRSRQDCHRLEMGVLAVSVPILCYVWLPLVYKASCFFLAALLVLVIFLCLGGLACRALRVSRLATLGFSIFAIWMLYIFWYTLALCLLN